MMTFEKKCFVSPRDVIAVQLKCAKCASATVIPVDKLKDADLSLFLTNVCPHCRTQRGFTYNTEELGKFNEFNIILSRLTALLEGRGVEYSFQVECPE